MFPKVLLRPYLSSHCYKLVAGFTVLPQSERLHIPFSHSLPPLSFVSPKFPPLRTTPVLSRSSHTNVLLSPSSSLHLLCPLNPFLTYHWKVLSLLFVVSSILSRPILSHRGTFGSLFSQRSFFTTSHKLLRLLDHFVPVF